MPRLRIDFRCLQRIDLNGANQEAVELLPDLFARKVARFGFAGRQNLHCEDPAKGAGEESGLFRRAAGIEMSGDFNFVTTFHNERGWD